MKNPPNRSIRAVITVAALGAMLVFLVAKQKHWDLKQEAWAIFKPPPAETPEDGVYKMLDAARTGDTRTYLDCFTGDMHRQLLQVVKETSLTQFSKYLVTQNTAFTGVAVSVMQNPDPGSARVRVEYVYSQRNEVQDLYLRKDEGKWKIFKVAGSEQIKTLIPYGTRVTD
jgi:hypothetical protein